MNIILNFKELIRQYVAPHRRQPVRLAWLQALADLEGLWASFTAWRDYYRYKVHVTSQHKSLQRPPEQDLRGRHPHQELR